MLTPGDATIRSRADVSFEKMREWLVVGSPTDCIEALERYRRDWGCDYIILRLRCGFGPSRDETADAIRLFGEQVLPHFNR
jgi:alkanesulfonate monooxygenase SsuD/methylene tetrahydromethanopterin reductase-like flavin-dependent oxidoreductase (luciferase family)